MGEQRTSLWPSLCSRERKSETSFSPLSPLSWKGFNNVFLSSQISFLPRTFFIYQSNWLFWTLSCSDVLGMLSLRWWRPKDEHRGRRWKKKQLVFQWKIDEYHIYCILSSIRMVNTLVELQGFFFSLTSHGQCKLPPSHTHTSIPNTYQEKPTYICFRRHFVQHTEETCYYKRLSICVVLSIFFFDPELLLQHALTGMLTAIIFINYPRCHWYRSSGPLSFLDHP